MIEFGCLLLRWDTYLNVLFLVYQTERRLNRNWAFTFDCQSLICFQVFGPFTAVSCMRAAHDMRSNLVHGKWKWERIARTLCWNLGERERVQVWRNRLCISLEWKYNTAALSLCQRCPCSLRCVYESTKAFQFPFSLHFPVEYAIKRLINVVLIGTHWKHAVLYIHWKEKRGFFWIFFYRLHRIAPSNATRSICCWTQIASNYIKVIRVKCSIFSLCN